METRIRALRKERGWTPAQLAERAGVSVSYISEIDRHVKTLNGHRIDAFARAFGVKPVDLVDDATTEPDILDHVKRLERLTEEDRQAVFRHAIALDPGDDPEVARTG